MWQFVFFLGKHCLVEYKKFFLRTFWYILISQTLSSVMGWNLEKKVREMFNKSYNYALDFGERI